MKKHTLIALSFVAIIALSACQPKTQPAGNGKETANGAKTASTTTGGPYAPNMEDCAGFTANDASALSGVPASELTTAIEMLYEGFWTCSFMGEGFKGVSFGVTIGKSEQEAIDDMESYMENLEVAAGLPQFSDAEEGAYSEIVGNGFEGIWTDVNKTLTARKGNITIQISVPTEKLDQVKVADAFFKKF